MRDSVSGCAPNTASSEPQARQSNDPGSSTNAYGLDAIAWRNIGAAMIKKDTNAGENAPRAEQYGEGPDDVELFLDRKCPKVGECSPLHVCRNQKLAP